MGKEKSSYIIEGGNSKELSEFQDYLLNVRRYSSNTVSSYSFDICDFTKFIRGLGKIFKDIKVDDVKSWILDLTERQIGKRSIKRKMSSLKSFYAWMYLQKKVDSDPFEYVHSPKATHALPDFFSEKEIDSLLTANEKRTDKLKDRDQALLMLMFASGLRASEVVNLTFNQVDFDNRIMKVSGKGNKDRLVPFTNSAKEAMLNYINGLRKDLLKEDTKYIFLNSKGNKMTVRGLEYILDEIEAKTGLYGKIHPHMLRHSFATKMLNRGADLRTIQELLGHSSIETTSIYTHVAYENMKETYEKTFPRAKKEDSNPDYDEESDKNQLK